MQDQALGHPHSCPMPLISVANTPGENAGALICLLHNKLYLLFLLLGLGFRLQGFDFGNNMNHCSLPFVEALVCLCIQSINACFMTIFFPPT